MIRKGHRGSPLQEFVAAAGGRFVAGKPGRRNSQVRGRSRALVARKVRNEKPGANEPPKERPRRPEPEVIPPHLSVREAGKRLRRSPTAVKGMVDRGELKILRIGRVLRVLESSIDEIVNQNI